MVNEILKFCEDEVTEIRRRKKLFKKEEPISWDEVRECVRDELCFVKVIRKIEELTEQANAADNQPVSVSGEAKS